MVPKRFMIVAGEASGDLLAAELVHALRDELARFEAQPTEAFQPLHASLEPVFFGAGGPRMAESGVDLAFDMTRDAVIGISDVLKKIGLFRRRMRALQDLAAEREPHAIICVDFSGFNLRFAHAVRQTIERERGTFYNWNPKIIQFVSPQVWASRPKRAKHLEHNIDLLLSILPFEKDWYARHAPKLKVEFVGHPIVDRYANFHVRETVADQPRLLLLPGSRVGELRRHVPVMAEAARLIRARTPLEVRMVLPNSALAELATNLLPQPHEIAIEVGTLPELLTRTEVAIAATGTVTLECAYFGVPTVAIYKTSWTTYHIAKRLIRVKYLAMPNLLADDTVFPEFVQHHATPQAIAAAAEDLLRSPEKRAAIRAKLAHIVAQLGKPGAARHAAHAIVRLLGASERTFPLRASLAG
jgi:lipid-A-disaccharide synthase